MKKFVWLLIALWMLFAAAAYGEEITLSSVYPAVKTLTSSSAYEGKTVLEELLRSNAEYCQDYLWQYEESSVSEESTCVIYVEFDYDDGRFISIMAFYSSLYDYPCVVIDYNGKEMDDHL